MLAVKNQKAAVSTLGLAKVLDYTTSFITCCIHNALDINTVQIFMDSGHYAGPDLAFTHHPGKPIDS